MVCTWQKALAGLVSLDLEQNPVADLDDYPDALFTLIPQLKFIDDADRCVRKNLGVGAGSMHAVAQVLRMRVHVHAYDSAVFFSFGVLIHVCGAAGPRCECRCPCCTGMAIHDPRTMKMVSVVASGRLKVSTLGWSCKRSVIMPLGLGAMQIRVCFHVLMGVLLPPD